MSTLPGRLALIGCLAVTSLALGRGERPASGERPRLDALGDPLPAEAVARLGTTRFRLLEQWEHFLGFSADGKLLLLAGGATRQLLHRDPRTYRVERRLPLGPSTYPRYACSADRRCMVCTNGEDVTLLDLITGKEVASIPGRAVFVRPALSTQRGDLTYRLSRDGRLLAVAGEEDRGAQLVSWVDVGTGKCLQRARARKGASFASLAFTWDGKALAAVEVEAGGARTCLHVWDVPSGKAISSRPLPHEARFKGLLSSLPDGKVLLGTNPFPGPVLVCDPATGQALRTFPQKGDGTQWFTLSPDGKTLLGSVQGLIRVWDVGTGRVIRELRLDSHSREAPYVYLSPDGKTLAAVGQHHLTLWDAGTGQQLYPTAGHNREVCSLAFSPAGDRLLSAGLTPGALLWDVASGKELAHLMPDVPRPFRDERVISANQGRNWLGLSYLGAQALFAPDGKSVAAVWPDLPVHVWRADTGELLHKLGREKAHQSLAFAAGGRFLAAADQDGEIRLWAVASGKGLDSLRVDAPRTPEQGAIKMPTVLASSPDGRSLAAARLVLGRMSFRLKIRQWEVAARAERRNLEQSWASRFSTLQGAGLGGHLRSDLLALCLRFSPDGRLLALGDGNVIYLWDAASGKEVRQFAGPEVFARTLAFSPDSKLLAAGRRDGRIRLWRTDTGTFLCDVPAHGRAVTALAFSPDGRLLASGSRDTTVLLWDVRELLRQPRTP